MISNGEKLRKAKSKGREVKSEGQQWQYLAVKKLLALLRGTTSEHHGDFYFFRNRKQTSIAYKSMCK